MAHPRSIRRTSGNLERFVVEYSVELIQDVKPVGENVLVTTNARVVCYSPTIPVSVAITEFIPFGAEHRVNKALAGQRDEALFALAGRFNTYLELFPDTLPPLEEDTG